MNLILKTNDPYLISINSDSELFFISPQNPLKLLDCASELTLKFYPTSNITNPVKLLPNIEKLHLAKTSLMSDSENCVIANYGDNNFVVEFKKHLFAQDTFPDCSFVLPSPNADTEIIAKNFGTPQILIFSYSQLISTITLPQNFDQIEYFENDNMLVVLANHKSSNSQTTSKIVPLLISSNKDNTNINNLGTCLVFDLTKQELKFKSNYNLLSYDNSSKTLSLLLKDFSMLKTATTYKMTIVQDFKLEKDKVHTTSLGSIKGLVPKKLIPIVFFEAIKSENYKEARFFLSDELNKKLDDTNLESFLENFTSIEQNPFAVFDTNFYLAKNKADDLCPIEFCFEKSKITNIKF